MTYALDSDVISFLLRKDTQVEANFKKAVDNGFEYIIPPMVYFEVKRWLVVKNATAQLLRFEKLCRFTRDVTMDIVSWDKAIEIYAALAKRGQLIGDGDTLIAAYCIVNNYTLVTNNTDDFERVDGLQLINWKE